MNKPRTILITGTSKGIGKYLVEHFSAAGHTVIGCSRNPADYKVTGYRHFCLDVANETDVKAMFVEIQNSVPSLDVLINNAGIASMNHVLLTPMKTVHNILNTNVAAVMLFCREAAKLMKNHKFGRIVNFATVATPLKLEGEAMYAASKAAVVSLTEIMARELAPFGITVNAVGPTPIKTDLIRSVPEDKLQALLNRQAIPRYGEFRDVSNVIEFFMSESSDFVTGQTVYLGGV